MKKLTRILYENYLPDYSEALTVVDNLMTTYRENYTKFNEAFNQLDTDDRVWLELNVECIKEIVKIKESLTSSLVSRMNKLSFKGNQIEGIRNDKQFIFYLQTSIIPRYEENTLREVLNIEKISHKSYWKSLDNKQIEQLYTLADYVQTHWGELRMTDEEVEDFRKGKK